MYNYSCEKKLEYTILKKGGVNYQTFSVKGHLKTKIPNENHQVTHPCD